MPHRCLPIEPDDCLSAILECAGIPDLDALDAILLELLGELNETVLGEVMDILEGILAKFSELLARLNHVLRQITDIGALIGRLDECVIIIGVECTPAGNLIAMLQARRDELILQAFELENNLDPIFGLPFQLGKFQSVLAEMLCFRLNAVVTRALIEGIKNPPPFVPPPVNPCP